MALPSPAHCCTYAAVSKSNFVEEFTEVLASFFLLAIQVSLNIYFPFAAKGFIGDNYPQQRTAKF